MSAIATLIIVATISAVALRHWQGIVAAAAEFKAWLRAVDDHLFGPPR